MTSSESIEGGRLDLTKPPFLSRTQGSNEGASVAKRVSRGLRAARPSRAAARAGVEGMVFTLQLSTTLMARGTTTHLSDSDTGVNGHVSLSRIGNLEWKISTRRAPLTHCTCTQHCAPTGTRQRRYLLDRSDSSHLTHPRFPCLLCLARATRGARRAAAAHVCM